jgi:hypothetical protein
VPSSVDVQYMPGIMNSMLGLMEVRVQVDVQSMPGIMNPMLGLMEVLD